MSEYEDLKVSSYEISLCRLTKRTVKDIVGYLSIEFGEAVFKITRIIFTDGTEVDTGGEHDIAFIENHHMMISELDGDHLDELYQEEHKHDED